jgi:hypothetical protein
VAKITTDIESEIERTKGIGRRERARERAMVEGGGGNSKKCKIEDFCLWSL